MTTARGDVDAAVAGLQARWGAAAPRVIGSLALAPAPDESHRSRTRDRGPQPRPATTGSSPPGSRALDAILGRAACRDPPASPSAATAPAAGPPWRCGSSPRPRRPGSVVAWLDLAAHASTRSRRSPAASGSSGSSSSPRPASTRAWRSRARCWPAARSTCSSSTCPAAGWRRPTSRPGSPTGSIDSPRSPVGRRSLLLILERPGSPAASRPRSPSRAASGSSSRGGRGSASGATSSASGRRRWSRAIDTARRGGGRRSGSSTRRAANATRCLRRDDLLVEAIPTVDQAPAIRHSNGPTAMRLLHLYRPHLPLALATARASEPFPTGPARAGRPAVGSGDGHRREPRRPGARRPAGDPAGERASARTGGGLRRSGS